MLRIKLAILPCCLALTVTSGTAVSADKPSVQAYGQSNQSCQEWTDGCVTCMRNQAASPSCSTSGIACQPRDVICQGPATRAAIIRRPHPGFEAKKMDGRSRPFHPIQSKRLLGMRVGVGGNRVHQRRRKDVI